MRFTYTYRSSDGQRHTADIEAECRDAVFTKVRTELGIKPIKVVAAQGDARPAENISPAPQGTWIWRTFVLVALALLLGGGVWWWLATHTVQPDVVPIQIMTPQGPVTYSVATSLSRQAIPGNRLRIENDRDGIFSNAVERLLARFAEPGRQVAALVGTRPTEAEFVACLKEPIHIASNELTEYIDLKRIVMGMKREMRAYLAGGGTIDGYLAELEKRQRLEISYRERAERKLNDLLHKRVAGQQEDSSSNNRNGVRSPANNDGAPSDAQAQPSKDLREAYDYWLKANAQLQAMGIYPLVLPDALRAYQMSLDIDE